MSNEVLRSSLVSYRGLIALLSMAMTLTACESTPLASSCGGGLVDRCGPFEYAEVTSASLGPTELRVADFSQMADLQITLDRCGPEFGGQAPAPHEVRITALIGDVGGDGGEGRSIHLLTIRDGEAADRADAEGVIEARIVNPLIHTLPANTDIILRFTPESTTAAGCAGASLEVPYRTGDPRPEG